MSTVVLNKQNHETIGVSESYAVQSETMPVSTDLFARVAGILEQARTNAVRSVNSTMVLAYWLIGREIAQTVLQGDERAEFGQGVLKTLSDQLTERCGRGFSLSNLHNFKKFYSLYPDRVTIFYPTGRKLPLTEIGHPTCGQLESPEKSYPAGSQFASPEIVYPTGRQLPPPEICYPPGSKLPTMRSTMNQTIQMSGQLRSFSSIRNLAHQKSSRISPIFQTSRKFALSCLYNLVSPTNPYQQKWKS